jgi:hypothetical protein
MRKYTPLLPVAAAYAASAITYAELASSGSPDFSPLLPFATASSERIPLLIAAFAIPTAALAVYFFLERLAAVKGPVEPLPQWWLNEKTGSAGVQRFEPTFHTVLFAVTSLLALMHLVLLGSILHWPDWFFRGFTTILGLGFMAVGNVMPRVRPNWIVGIRTKRTLSDPAIWTSAHRALGTLLMIAGIVTIAASIVTPRWALIVAIVSLLAALAMSGLVSSTTAASTPTAK